MGSAIQRHLALPLALEILWVKQVPRLHCRRFFPRSVHPRRAISSPAELLPADGFRSNELGILGAGSTAIDLSLALCDNAPRSLGPPFGRQADNCCALESRTQLRLTARMPTRRLPFRKAAKNLKHSNHTLTSPADSTSARWVTCHSEASCQRKTIPPLIPSNVLRPGAVAEVWVYALASTCDCSGIMAEQSRGRHLLRCRCLPTPQPRSLCLQPNRGSLGSHPRRATFQSRRFRPR